VQLASLCAVAAHRLSIGAEFIRLQHGAAFIAQYNAIGAVWATANCEATLVAIGVPVVTCTSAGGPGSPRPPLGLGMSPPEKSTPWQHRCIPRTTANGSRRRASRAVRYNMRVYDIKWTANTREGGSTRINRILSSGVRWVHQIKVGRSASKMDQNESWWWAFEMVQIDRMARVRHNGAESGHQLPLEDGPCAPPSWTRWNAF
jgi:hypothetical protein